MRIVVDTNIAFSSILNTNSKIARIILQPRSRLNFYSTEQLKREIEEHRLKILALTNYSEPELDRVIELITRKIRFVNIELISKQSYMRAISLTQDIDVDDAEFIALTEHLRGWFWSGDKELRDGLLPKGWDRFISTSELFDKTKFNR